MIFYFLLMLNVTFRMKAGVELALMTLTLVLTVVWSVEVGVLSSVAISLLLVVKKSSQPRMTILVCLFP